MKAKVTLLIVALCYSAGLFAQSMDLRGQRDPTRVNYTSDTHNQKSDINASLDPGVGKLMMTDCFVATVLIAPPSTARAGRW